MIRVHAGFTAAALLLLSLIWQLPEAQGQTRSDIKTLTDSVVRLHREGRYAEATEAAKRVVTLSESAYGRDHVEVGIALNDLAILYTRQKHDREAIPLFARALSIIERKVGPNSPDLTGLLADLAYAYQRVGRVTEAESLFKRALSIVEKAPRADREALRTALANLAQLYSSQRRLTDAEPLLKRELAITEEIAGRDHLDTAKSAYVLALVQSRVGRLAEAEPLFRRALAIWDAQRPDQPEIPIVIEELWTLLVMQRRYADVIPVLQRAIGMAERARQTDSTTFVTMVETLAHANRLLGRYSEAESLMKRALAAEEKARGPGEGAVRILTGIGNLYRQLNRSRDAEGQYRRALALAEKASPQDRVAIATAAYELGKAYNVQDRLAEAEPLLQRALSLREAALGQDHIDVARTLVVLGKVLLGQNRYRDAEGLLKRAVAAYNRIVGPQNSQRNLDRGMTLAEDYVYQREKADALYALGYAFQFQGQLVEAGKQFLFALAAMGRETDPSDGLYASIYGSLAEMWPQGRQEVPKAAEEALRQAVASAEKTGKHRGFVIALANLGRLLGKQEQFAESETLMRRALQIIDTTLGDDHPDVFNVTSSLAALQANQGKWTLAAEYWKRATAVTVRKRQRDVVIERPALGQAKTDANRVEDFRYLVQVEYQVARAQPTLAPALSRDMFVAAQWAQLSDAASSLTQMAARGASGDPALAAMVRERQDLVAEWSKLDQSRVASVALDPEKRDPSAMAVTSKRLEAIDFRIGAIDRQLSVSFPNFVAFSRPDPSSVEGVQADLRPDEALILFMDASSLSSLPEETFIWIVTKSQLRWARSELGTAALKREVAALRCGLDRTAWEGDGADNCARNLGIPREKAPRPNQPLPFDHARAYQLYKGLFGEVQDLIKGKHLLIVPSGALTQLPFQLLVTQKPDPNVTGLEAMRKATWLVREHAISVLPAVSSLKALRRVGKPSAGSRPMVGFGNPLLDGPSASYVADAKAARDRQQCQPAGRQQVATLRDARGGIGSLTQRSGIVNVSDIRALIPLPGTADELCLVAADLGAKSEDIRLAARATERAVKAMSESGALAGYRVVHFATHGAVAGEIKKNAEPGLILTPPDKATEEDDGYLSASEIAALKLDAEWVVLSACNTAASGADGAEALSGLARAFFYAGARALLVSHWSVDSAATVALITKAVSELRANPSIGRAEALRRAMLGLIDSKAPLAAHPAYWAPFVVVGEGGRGS